MADQARGWCSSGMVAGNRPDEILADTPAELWDELLRAVRRAVDRLEGAQIPTGLRPFARWTPEALRATHRARAAVASAVTTDARFRECVAEVLGDGDTLEAAGSEDAAALRERFGPQLAFALLAARARWDAVTQLAAEVADELAAADQAAAEARAGTAPRDVDTNPLRIEVSELGRALQAARSQLDASEQRLAEAARRERTLGDERDAARQAHAEAIAERDQARAERDHERSLHRERLARLRRQVRSAEARATASDARRREVLAGLTALVDRLREPLDPEPRRNPAQQSSAGEVERIPRVVSAATPGRPCLLPAGVDPDSSLAAQSLLQIRDLQVLVDGYNVTKSPRGVPEADLEHQRRWLVKLASGIVARFGVRITLVFDGQRDVLDTPGPKARGVLVVFTDSDELADERLLALVDALDATQPVLVVSSDRELREAASGRDANTVPSGAFLAASSSAAR